MSTVVSCLCNHQYLHVVWLSNMVNHHLELGKLASNEGYVLDGGRVALEKRCLSVRVDLGPNLQVKSQTMLLQDCKASMDVRAS